MSKAGLILAAAFALTIAAPAQSAAGASSRSCGSFRNGASFHSDGGYYDAYYTVHVAGPASCLGARQVMRRWEDPFALASPRGWRCVHNNVYAPYASTCRRPRVVVRDYFSSTLVACDDIRSSDGTETATGIDVHGGRCSTGRTVARDFMDDPSCAVNFQSQSAYDCYVAGYHCTGDIVTARESDISCTGDRRIGFIVDT